MSRISAVYEHLLSTLATEFNRKTRIPNPYDLAQNAKMFLVDGYGVKIGPATYQPFEFNTMVVSRRITVVFALEVFKKESDVEIVDDAATLLLEDIYSVQKLLYSYSGTTNAEVMKVDVLETSEISSINVEKQNSLTMEASFEFWIKENL